MMPGISSHHFSTLVSPGSIDLCRWFISCGHGLRVRIHHTSKSVACPNDPRGSIIASSLDSGSPLGARVHLERVTYTCCAKEINCVRDRCTFGYLETGLTDEFIGLLDCHSSCIFCSGLRYFLLNTMFFICSFVPL